MSQHEVRQCGMAVVVAVDIFPITRCSGKVVIVARRMIPLLPGQWQAHSPSAGTAESQMTSPLSWGIGRAATLLKTLLQYFG